MAGLGAWPSLTSAHTGNDFEQLTIRTVLGPNEATVLLTGELDVATAPAFAEELDGIETRGVHRLIVDLAGLEFIDSSGLKYLVVALKRQRERGGDVVLHSPRPSILRVLEIVGLTDLFTIA